MKRTSKATVSKFISAKYQEHKKIELTGVPELTADVSSYPVGLQAAKQAQASISSTNNGNKPVAK